MDFEWDPAKAALNRRKHGVDLADAIGVFDDPYALTRPELFAREERYVTLGRDLLDRVLVVVWTATGDALRLISARRATAKERRQYAEDIDA
jgi:uncharacterized DUF497 family protein